MFAMSLLDSIQRFVWMVKRNLEIEPLTKLALLELSALQAARVSPYVSELERRQAGEIEQRIRDEVKLAREAVPPEQIEQRALSKELPAGWADLVAIMVATQ